MKLEWSGHWDRRHFWMAALLVVTLFAAFFSAWRAEPEETVLVVEDTASAGQRAHSGEARILVYVSGAVSRAGVYELPRGARVYEALEAAGHAAPYAGESLNLSAPLSDGEQIHVPFSPVPDERPGGALVNINTADKAALMMLPGVGEATAQKILDHREKNGLFREREDLMEVPSIGEKRYARLADRITL